MEASESGAPRLVTAAVFIALGFGNDSGACPSCSVARKEARAKTVLWRGLRERKPLFVAAASTLYSDLVLGIRCFRLPAAKI